MDINRLIGRVTGGFDGSCHATEVEVCRQSAIVGEEGHAAFELLDLAAWYEGSGKIESRIDGEMAGTYS